MLCFTKKSADRYGEFLRCCELAVEDILYIYIVREKLKEHMNCCLEHIGHNNKILFERCVYVRGL